MGRHIDAIPASALESLARYDWPGNIRELQNVLERSVILTQGNTLRITMPEVREPPVRTSKAAQGTERQTIVKALENIPGVAQVDVNGRVTRQILIQIKPSQLASLGIGVDQVMTAVQNANQDVPAVG